MKFLLKTVASSYWIHEKVSGRKKSLASHIIYETKKRRKQQNFSKLCYSDFRHSCIHCLHHLKVTLDENRSFVHEFVFRFWLFLNSTYWNKRYENCVEQRYSASLVHFFVSGKKAAATARLCVVLCCTVSAMKWFGKSMHAFGVNRVQSGFFGIEFR